MAGRSQQSAVALATAVAAWGTIAAVHYHRLGLTLAHFDARAHLVVSRRIFDNLIPGWQQVGAVWLPLPHLLDALPVQIDFLYRTGYSGVAISIASMALAAWAIATLIARATGSIAGGIVAAAIMMLNPDLLYLQSTPLSEPLLLGTTCLAVALIAEWVRNVGGPPSPADRPTGFGGTAARRASTRAAGWGCVAAVLSRYEAWPMIAAAIVLAFVVLVRRGLPAMTAFRAVRGLALWPLWAIAAFLVNSKITVGSWFVSSGFFTPDNPALGRPWLAWTQIWHGMGTLMGPILPWLAVIAAIALLIAFVRAADDARRSAFLILALAACAILQLGAYFKGHPVRIRYDVPLVAVCAALIGMGIALLPRRVAALAGALVIALAVWQRPPFIANPPVVVESLRDAGNETGRQAVTSYLASHWDGEPIMMSMGSLSHYMHDLSRDGFRVRDFLHEGDGNLWRYAVQSPRLFVEWIAVEEVGRGGDALYWQGRRDPRFFEGYTRVAEGGGVALYRRK